MAFYFTRAFLFLSQPSAGLGCTGELVLSLLTFKNPGVLLPIDV